MDGVRIGARRAASRITSSWETIGGTLDAAVNNLDDAREIAGDESQRDGEPEEAVADKGYHGKLVLLSLQQEGWHTYIAEPERGRQKWPEQQLQQEAVYANRRRKNGCRGRASAARVS